MIKKLTAWLGFLFSVLVVFAGIGFVIVIDGRGMKGKCTGLVDFG